MPRQRPKSIDAEVTKKLIAFEAYVYKRAENWKKLYRYTLIDEFRRHITSARLNTVAGLDYRMRYRSKKSTCFEDALVDLTLAESSMELMIQDEINIMSAAEWSECAARIDEVRINLSRLLSSLKASGSESPNCGTETASAEM